MSDSSPSIAANALMEDSQIGNMGIHSICVIQDGAVIFEEYAQGSRNEARPVFHVVNAFVSLAIGVCIDRGLIESVDQPVLDFFPEYSERNSHPFHQRVTIENLLTMTAGYSWESEHHDLPIAEFVNNPNLEEYIFSLPFNSVPGERYWQNSGGVYLLTRIVEKTTGLSFEDFVQQTILDPLEMHDARLSRDPKGISKGPYMLKLTTIELARFGQMFLEEGVQNGRRIVCRDWIDQATSVQVSLNPLAEVFRLLGEEGVGYSWWVFERMYVARGHSGQYLFVVPESNTVISLTAHCRMSVPAELYLKHLKPVLNPKN